MTEYWPSSFLHIYSQEEVEVNKKAKKLKNESNSPPATSTDQA